jgi:anti-sigma regulatory factor (Ser/Thr protein kinase)
MSRSSQVFGVTSTAVAQVRRFVGDHLDEIEAGIAYDVVLMASELATNAVLHGRTQFEVTLVLDASEGSVRFEVQDHGRGDVARKVPGAYDGTGRGLQIVDLLADDWGSRTSEDGTGKTVWFVVFDPSFTTTSRRCLTSRRRMIETQAGRGSDQAEQPSGSLR